MHQRNLSEIPIIKMQEKVVPDRRYLQADPTMQDKKYTLKDDTFNIIGRNSQAPQKSTPAIKPIGSD